MSRKLMIEPHLMENGAFDSEKVKVVIESENERDMSVSINAIDLIQMVAHTIGKKITVAEHAGDLDV